jgi:hypothetical protein
MDSWVSMHGISTFSLTIGEWFLGCLILLYLIFPLLRFFMIKSEKFFFIIATGIYLIVLFHYDFSVPHPYELLPEGLRVRNRYDDWLLS